jgi:hypothetical protein
MTREVVCISRTLGAKGDVVGRLVAERLGFRYVDEEIVVRAAELAETEPAVVAAAEHRPPWHERFLAKLAQAAELARSAPPPSDGRPASAVRPAPGDTRALIRTAIVEVAKGGRAVIVAHAASHALAFVEDVLRVLVTASGETRSRRVAAAEGLSAADAAAAVAASDTERRDYFRRFYDVKEELPTHYDLVVNTDVLTPEQAVELIVCAAQGAGRS